MRGKFREDRIVLSKENWRRMNEKDRKAGEDHCRFSYID